jgi:uncharacterized protein (DUF305 family)
MKVQMKMVTTVIISAFVFINCNNDGKTTTNESNESSSSKTSDAAKDTLHNMDKDHSMANDNKMMGCMNSMMDKMKNVKMTGDFDIDFANMMIEHHKGAVEMSEEEVKSGTDEKIKAMAQKIITTQKAEIDKLKDFVSTYKPSGMKHGEGELQKSMSDMESKMHSNTMTGDTDKDFAAMMILHHEEAVSMSKKELTNGMSAPLKKVAQKIIAGQTQEIKAFKDWLDTRK